jgi:cobalamin biosynthesis protein CbiG
MSGRVTLGIGLSSKATAGEIRALVEAVLDQHHVQIGDVSSIATRERFRHDRRLQLGPAIVSYSDAILEAHSTPCERTVGPRARVAETAALLAAGTDGLLAPVRRSANVTVAIAASANGSEP